MAERLVGLDIGTAGVRVAEVDPGDPPVVRAFGEVSLPPGALRDGEVVDPEAVTDAIRRLWREAGLKPRDRRVRLALASERVFVRIIDLPAVPDAELEGALLLQAGEYVPIPVDEAVIGFDLLERVSGPDGDEMVRVLLVAAQREIVDALVKAAESAGLAVTGVDLLPLAVARGLGFESTDGAEAIVSVGAAVTSVMVHEGGRPRLVRIVATGGETVTRVLSEQFGLTPSAAEEAKRHPDRVAAAGPGALAEIAAAVQNSLGFYQTQADSPPVRRVVLTGGGALTPGLADLLAEVLATPVEPARPRDHLDVSAAGLPEDRMDEVDALLPTAAGIALGGRRAPGVRIDLVPAEVRARVASRLVRRRLGLAAAALVAVLVAATVASFAATAGSRDRLAEQERRNDVIAGEIPALERSAQLSQELTRLRSQISTALEGDIAWSAVLEDLGAAIPDGVWLTSFGLQRSDNAGAGGSSAPVAAGPAALGAASFGGAASEFPAVARWLNRMSRLPYYSGLSVSSATKVSGGAEGILTFDSSSTVGPAGRSDRAERLLAGAP